MIFIFGMLVGVVLLLGFILYRMMSNEGWDDSNITNAIRLLAHVTLHAEDFGKMYYIEWGEPEASWNDALDRAELKRPFWYVSKDELSEVVDTRP